MQRNKNNYRVVFLYVLIGLSVPVVFLLNAFVVPEPYSHPLINVALTPTHCMPFLADRELMRELTQWVFGRQTPNFAPITIVILVVFWFFISITVLFFIRRILARIARS